MFLETSDELTGRYNGTFVGLQQGGGRIAPVLVRSFAGGRKGSRELEGAIYYKKDKNVLYDVFRRNVDYDEVVWPAPQLGFINCMDSAARYVYRLPEGQPARYRGLHPYYIKYWYKGPKMHSFSNIGLDTLMADPNAADVVELYNPSYMSVNEAWVKIREGANAGAAVSRNIALFKTNLSKKPAVLYKTSLVGLYNSASDKIYLRKAAGALVEEISQYATCEVCDVGPVPEQHPPKARVGHQTPGIAAAKAAMEQVMQLNVANVQADVNWNVPGQVFVLDEEQLLANNEAQQNELPDEENDNGI